MLASHLGEAVDLVPRQPPFPLSAVLEPFGQILQDDTVSLVAFFLVLSLVVGVFPAGVSVALVVAPAIAACLGR